MSSVLRRAPTRTRRGKQTRIPKRRKRRTGPPQKTKKATTKATSDSTSVDTLLSGILGKRSPSSRPGDAAVYQDSLSAMISRLRGDANGDMVASVDPTPDVEPEDRVSSRLDPMASSGVQRGAVVIDTVAGPVTVDIPQELVHSISAGEGSDPDQSSIFVRPAGNHTSPPPSVSTSTPQHYAPSSPAHPPSSDRPADSKEPLARYPAQSDAGSSTVHAPAVDLLAKYPLTSPAVPPDSTIGSRPQPPTLGVATGDPSLASVLSARWDDKENEQRTPRDRFAITQPPSTVSSKDVSATTTTSPSFKELGAVYAFSRTSPLPAAEHKQRTSPSPSGYNSPVSSALGRLLGRQAAVVPVQPSRAYGVRRGTSLMQRMYERQYGHRANDAAAMEKQQPSHSAPTAPSDTSASVVGDASPATTGRLLMPQPDPAAAQQPAIRVLASSTRDASTSTAPIRQEAWVDSSDLTGSSRVPAGLLEPAASQYASDSAPSHQPQTLPASQPPLAATHSEVVAPEHVHALGPSVGNDQVFHALQNELTALSGLQLATRQARSASQSRLVRQMETQVTGLLHQFDALHDSINRKRAEERARQVELERQAELAAAAQRKREARMRIARAAARRAAQLREEKEKAAREFESKMLQAGQIWSHQFSGAVRTEMQGETERLNAKLQQLKNNTESDIARNRDTIRDVLVESNARTQEMIAQLIEAQTQTMLRVEQQKLEALRGVQPPTQPQGGGADVMMASPVLEQLVRSQAALHTRLDQLRDAQQTTSRPPSRHGRRPSMGLDAPHRSPDLSPQYSQDFSDADDQAADALNGTAYDTQFTDISALPGSGQDGAAPRSTAPSVMEVRDGSMVSAAEQPSMMQVADASQSDQPVDVVQIIPERIDGPSLSVAERIAERIRQPPGERAAVNTASAALEDSHEEEMPSMIVAQDSSVMADQSLPSMIHVDDSAAVMIEDSGAEVQVDGDTIVVDDEEDIIIIDDDDAQHDVSAVSPVAMTSTPPSGDAMDPDVVAQEAGDQDGSDSFEIVVTDSPAVPVDHRAIDPDDEALIVIEDDDAQSLTVSGGPPVPREDSRMHEAPEQLIMAVPEEIISDAPEHDLAVPVDQTSYHGTSEYEADFADDTYAADFEDESQAVGDKSPAAPHTDYSENWEAEYYADADVGSAAHDDKNAKTTSVPSASSDGSLALYSTQQQSSTSQSQGLDDKQPQTSTALAKIPAPPADSSLSGLSADVSSLAAGPFDAYEARLASLAQVGRSLDSRVDTRLKLISQLGKQGQLSPSEVKQRRQQVQSFYIRERKKLAARKLHLEEEMVRVRAQLWREQELAEEKQLKALREKERLDAVVAGLPNDAADPSSVGAFLTDSASADGPVDPHVLSTMSEISGFDPACALELQVHPGQEGKVPAEGDGAAKGGAASRQLVPYGTGVPSGAGVTNGVVGSTAPSATTPGMAHVLSELSATTALMNKLVEGQQRSHQAQAVEMIKLARQQLDFLERVHFQERGVGQPPFPRPSPHVPQHQGMETGSQSDELGGSQGAPVRSVGAGVSIPEGPVADRHAAGGTLRRPLSEVDVASLTSEADSVRAHLISDTPVADQPSGVSGGELLPQTQPAAGLGVDDSASVHSSQYDGRAPTLSDGEHAHAIVRPDDRDSLTGSSVGSYGADFSPSPVAQSTAVQGGHGATAVTDSVYGGSVNDSVGSYEADFIPEDIEVPDTTLHDAPHTRTDAVTRPLLSPVRTPQLDEIATARREVEARIAASRAEEAYQLQAAQALEQSVLEQVQQAREDGVTEDVDISVQHVMGAQDGTDDSSGPVIAAAVEERIDQPDGSHEMEHPDYYVDESYFADNRDGDTVNPEDHAGTHNAVHEDRDGQPLNVDEAGDIQNVQPASDDRFESHISGDASVHGGSPVPDTVLDQVVTALVADSVKDVLRTSQRDSNLSTSRSSVLSDADGQGTDGGDIRSDSRVHGDEHVQVGADNLGDNRGNQGDNNGDQADYSGNQGDDDEQGGGGDRGSIMEPDHPDEQLPDRMLGTCVPPDDVIQDVEANRSTAGDTSAEYDYSADFSTELGHESADGSPLHSQAGAQGVPPGTPPAMDDDKPDASTGEWVVDDGTMDPSADQGIAAHPNVFDDSVIVDADGNAVVMIDSEGVDNSTDVVIDESVPVDDSVVHVDADGDSVLIVDDSLVEASVHVNDAVTDHSGTLHMGDGSGDDGTVEVDADTTVLVGDGGTVTVDGDSTILVDDGGTVEVDENVVLVVDDGGVDVDENVVLIDDGTVEVDGDIVLVDDGVVEVDGDTVVEVTDRDLAGDSASAGDVDGPVSVDVHDETPHSGTTLEGSPFTATGEQPSSSDDPNDLTEGPDRLPGTCLPPDDVQVPSTEPVLGTCVPPDDIQVDTGAGPVLGACVPPEDVQVDQDSRTGPVLGSCVAPEDVNSADASVPDVGDSGDEGSRPETPSGTCIPHEDGGDTDGPERVLGTCAPPDDADAPTSPANVSCEVSDDSWVALDPESPAAVDTTSGGGPVTTGIDDDSQKHPDDGTVAVNDGLAVGDSATAVDDSVTDGPSSPPGSQPDTVPSDSMVDSVSDEQSPRTGSPSKDVLDGALDATLDRLLHSWVLESADEMIRLRNGKLRMQQHREPGVTQAADSVEQPHPATLREKDYAQTHSVTHRTDASGALADAGSHASDAALSSLGPSDARTPAISGAAGGDSQSVPPGTDSGRSPDRALHPRPLPPLDDSEQPASPPGAGVARLPPTEAVGSSEQTASQDMGGTGQGAGTDVASNPQRPEQTVPSDTFTQSESTAPSGAFDAPEGPPVAREGEVSLSAFPKLSVQPPIDLLSDPEDSDSSDSDDPFARGMRAAKVRQQLRESISLDGSPLVDPQIERKLRQLQDDGTGLAKYLRAVACAGMSPSQTEAVHSASDMDMVALAEYGVNSSYAFCKGYSAAVLWLLCQSMNETLTKRLRCAALVAFEIYSHLTNSAAAGEQRGSTDGAGHSVSDEQSSSQRTLADNPQGVEGENDASSTSQSASSGASLPNNQDHCRPIPLTLIQHICCTMGQLFSETGEDVDSIYVRPARSTLSAYVRRAGDHGSDAFPIGQQQQPEILFGMHLSDMPAYSWHGVSGGAGDGVSSGKGVLRFLDVAWQLQELIRQLGWVVGVVQQMALNNNNDDGPGPQTTPFSSGTGFSTPLATSCAPGKALNTPRTPSRHVHTADRHLMYVCEISLFLTMFVEQMVGALRPAPALLATAGGESKDEALSELGFDATLLGADASRSSSMLGAGLIPAVLLRMLVGQDSPSDDAEPSRTVRHTLTDSVRQLRLSGVMRWLAGRAERKDSARAGRCQSDHQSTASSSESSGVVPVDRPGSQRSFPQWCELLRATRDDTSSSSLPSTSSTGGASEVSEVSTNVLPPATPRLRMTRLVIDGNGDVARHPGQGWFVVAALLCAISKVLRCRMEALCPSDGDTVQEEAGISSGDNGHTSLPGPPPTPAIPMCFLLQWGRRVYQSVVFGTPLTSVSVLPVGVPNTASSAHTGTPGQRSSLADDLRCAFGSHAQPSPWLSPDPFVPAMPPVRACDGDALSTHPSGAPQTHALVPQGLFRLLEQKRSDYIRKLRREARLLNGSVKVGRVDYLPVPGFLNINQLHHNSRVFAVMCTVLQEQQRFPPSGLGPALIHSATRRSPFARGLRTRITQPAVYASACMWAQYLDGSSFAPPPSLSQRHVQLSRYFYTPPSTADVLRLCAHRATGYRHVRLPRGPHDTAEGRGAGAASDEQRSPTVVLSSPSSPPTKAQPGLRGNGAFESPASFIENSNEGGSPLPGSPLPPDAPPSPVGQQAGVYRRAFDAVQVHTEPGGEAAGSAAGLDSEGKRGSGTPNGMHSSQVPDGASVVPVDRTVAEALLVQRMISDDMRAIGRPDPLQCGDVLEEVVEAMFQEVLRSCIDM